MVHCCVPGCINHSSKTSNISYHRIPNDKGLQKAWLARIRRENLPPLQNCYVCSEHFTDDCFETDLKAQLMPELRVKRRLKRDAIPSVFSFGPEPKKPRISSENRESRQRAEELRQEVSVEYRTQTCLLLKFNKMFQNVNSRLVVFCLLYFSKCHYPHQSID